MLRLCVVYVMPTAAAGAGRRVGRHVVAWEDRFARHVAMGDEGLESLRLEGEARAPHRRYGTRPGRRLVNVVVLVGSI